MPESTFNTVQLHQCVQRWREGDRAAADELLRSVGERLEHLTRKMLRGFPQVRDRAETMDVLQGSLIRLLNTLRKIQPATTRDFINLAAVHVRRELIDLARRWASRPQLQSAPAADSDTEPGAGVAGISDQVSESPEDLELWCHFHEAVEQLPAEEREVVGLVFYHGWTYVQIAELFQVDERTARRRWQSACLKLHRLVGGQLPAL